jgi:hypothetical protein
MNQPLAHVMEASIQMAWDYLDRTGELGDPEIAARILLDTVENMIRRGERRPLMLSNRAIDAWKRVNNARQA